MNATCQQLEERFVELGDDAFLADAANQSHLAACHSCTAIYGALAQVDRMVAAMPVVDATHVTFEFEPSLMVQRVQRVQRDWHAVIDDQQVGPFSFEQLQEEWHAGRVGEETMVWRAGMADWQPVAQVDALAELCATQPRARVLGSANGTALPQITDREPAGPQWQPSAAQGLADLMKQELDAAQAPKEATASTGATLGLPEVGARPGARPGAGSDASLDSVLQMSSGATGWSLPVPTQRSGVRPWQIVSAGLGVALAAAMVLFLVIRDSTPEPTQVAARPSNPVFAVAPAPPPVVEKQPRPSKVQVTPPRDDKRVAKGAAERKRTRPGQDAAGERPTPVREKPKTTALTVIDKKVILAGVKQQAKTVIPCLSAAKSRGELTKGRYQLILAWTIQPSGKVSGAKVKGPPSVLGTSIPTCFASKMSRWKFPASAKGMPVRNFPFPAFTVR